MKGGKAQDERWGGEGERESGLDPQSFQLATEKNILTGHKAKLLAHRIRQKEKNLVFTLTALAKALGLW